MGEQLATKSPSQKDPINKATAVSFDGLEKPTSKTIEFLDHVQNSKNSKNLQKTPPRTTDAETYEKKGTGLTCSASSLRSEEFPATLTWKAKAKNAKNVLRQPEEVFKNKNDSHDAKICFYDQEEQKGCGYHKKSFGTGPLNIKLGRKC